jgi:NADH:ubiquinone oxidoreductase subunit 2 (subunit N)
MYFLKTYLFVESKEFFCFFTEGALIILIIITFFIIPLLKKKLSPILFNNFLNAFLTFIIFFFMGLAVFLFYFFLVDLNWRLEGISLFNNFFFFDYHIAFVKFIILLLGILILVYSSFVWRIYFFENNSYIFLFLFFILLSLLMISSFDLMSLFLNLEALAFLSYILIVINWKTNKSVEATTKYYYLSSLSAVFFLIGIVCLYCAFLTTNLFSLYLFLKEDAFILFIGESTTVFIILFSFLVLFLSFFFKLGIFPGHMWLADIYEGVDWLTLWLFAVPLKFVIGNVFLRFINLFDFYLNKNVFFPWFFFISINGSLLIGALFALQQTRIKKFFAYASVTQMGYFLFSIALFSFNGYLIAFFFLLAYIGSGILFFSILLYIDYVLTFYYHEAIFISDLFIFRDKYFFFKYLIIVFTFVLFSMAGVPPFIGFFSKYLIITNGILHSWYFTTICAFLVSCISIFYYLRFLKIVIIENNSIERFILPSSTFLKVELDNKKTESKEQIINEIETKAYFTESEFFLIEEKKFVISYRLLVFHLIGINLLWLSSFFVVKVLQISSFCIESIFVLTNPL